MAIYNLDCEFMQDGSQTVDLISIALASSDGRTYYAESLDFDPGKANDFVRKEVLPKLGPIAKRKTRALIRDEIRSFVGDDPEPIFMAYYCAYDWVCMTELFGSFGALPKTWPKLCWDLKCLVLLIGATDLPPDPKDAHNALADAQWGLLALQHLEKNYGFKFPPKLPKVPEAPEEDQVPEVVPAEEASGIWGIFGQIKEQVLNQPVSSRLIPPGAKGRFYFEAIGDNTVDNLVDDLKRSTSIELAQFVVGLLNTSLSNFSYAYSLPQHDGFEAALKAVTDRFRLMDGSEQGDLFTKIQIMFKDLLVSRYGDLGPDAAEMVAVKYAKQMIDFLKSQSIQAADLSLDYQGKFY